MSCTHELLQGDILSTLSLDDDGHTLRGQLTDYDGKLVDASFDLNGFIGGDNGN